MTDFSALEARMVGPVFVPGDDGFADEVSGFNLAVTHTPEVAVGLASLDDAIAAVEFASRSRMHVSMLATGHGSHAPVRDGMLVTTRRLDTVSVDPSTRIATIGAGVRWAEVVAAAAAHGLAPITGSSANVGVVGYLLGGGHGPLARSHGISSDYVRGFTVVSATGEVLDVTAESEPDLFWALRGGKGGLGLVTEVRIELVELSTLYGGALVFPEEHIDAAFRGWIEYTKTADDDVTTSVAIMHFPPVEQVPEVFRGKTLLMLRFAFPGDATRGAELAAPLRALAPAVMDTMAEMPASAIASIHNDPTDPGPAFSRGLLLNGLDDEFATALLSVVGAGTQTPVMVTELRHLGGATDHDVPGGSAAGGRASGYSMSLIGAPNPALFAEVLPGATTALIAAIDPWVSEETAINFAGDPAGDQFAKAWPPKTSDRLRAIRSSVDPDRVFAYGPTSA